MKEVSYVLITPAKNEADLIEGTIRSIISQTKLPDKWVIISDSSTDGTDEIAESYSRRFSFIKLLRLEKSHSRDFGSKAKAIGKALPLISALKYDYIGFLDADITMDKDYFRKLINEMERDNDLGISGGVIFQLINGDFVDQKNNLKSVAGAVQMFRRKCFEQIGGYKELKYGGIDAVAEVMARMEGWTVRTIPDLPVKHHRMVGDANGNRIKTSFKYGQREYFRGTSLIYWTLKAFSRVMEFPLMISTLSMIWGFIYAGIFKADEMILSREIIRYTRWEQNKRLLNFFNMGKRDSITER